MVVDAAVRRGGAAVRRGGAALKGRRFNWPGLETLYLSLSAKNDGEDSEKDSPGVLRVVRQTAAGLHRAGLIDEATPRG